MATSNTASPEHHTAGEIYPWLGHKVALGLATSNSLYRQGQAWPIDINIGLAIPTRATPNIGGLPSGFRAREAIHELRRLSGLTWEDMADLLSVTRRSLHLWANGGAINGPNEKHVRDLLMALRALDRGTAHENRSLLLAPRAEGGTFADLLRKRRFEEAITLAGRGRGRPASPATTSAPTLPGPIKLSVADMLGTSAERVQGDENRALPPRRRRPSA